MQIHLDYLIINYTEKDIKYIDQIKDFINRTSHEILEFLNIKNMDKKINVYLYDSLTDFRKKYKEVSNKYKEVPLWLCGFAYKDQEIYTLCLDEYRKTEYHKNVDTFDLMYLILHEFVHIVHNYFEKINNYGKENYAWLNEGMAITLSHQFDNKKIKFDATLDEMINGCSNYSSYHAMFIYALENYGRDYIIELISNYNKLVEDTPKLYDKVNETYSNKKYCEKR